MATDDLIGMNSISIQGHSTTGAQLLTPHEIKRVLKSFHRCYQKLNRPCSCLACKAVTYVPAWRIWREAYWGNAMERRLEVLYDSDNICCRDV
jgi:hypothetical protein